METKEMYKIVTRSINYNYIEVRYKSCFELQDILSSSNTVLISAELVAIKDANTGEIYDHHNGLPTIKTEYGNIKNFIANKYGRCDESTILIRPVEETED